MSFDLNAIDPVRAAHIASQRPSAPASGAAGAGFADALRAQAASARVDAIPASPPREVMDEVLAAQRAIEDMHARGRQLHFEIDSGRVKILLQDLDGNVVKEIAPSHALEIAGGRAAE
jgi:beta-lactamase class A